MSDPNWAEIVTAVATAVGSVGLVSTLGLVLVSGRQLREAQHARHAQLAADFIRRWDEDSLVETRRLVAQFESRDALAAAFRGYIETNSVSAYVLYRELDFFEQLGALESIGAFDFDLINVLAGRLIVDRYELWKPSIAAMGDDVYPMFGALAAKLRRTLAV
ncbi:MAG TPA: hypothetical protein VH914_14590 [Acidimicrobiia bacterium]|jgi:hypothetical protein|nr:hypothetical protein [Acidimicrobiia bacterium]